MGAGHDHTNGTATGRHRRRLVLVLTLTLSVVGVQVVGGLMSGSLALLADAGHMLADASGVAIALIASVLAARPATNARTYGLQRAEILAALANAVLLGVLAVWVIVQAVRRWNDPPEIASGLMLVVALVGAVANLVSLLVLRGARDDSLDVRGAYLEVLGDLVGSVAVIIAAVVIATTGYTRADVIASVGIGLFILPRAWGLLRDVLDVLLEATPKGLDLDMVREHIRGVPVLSAHVVVDQDCIDAGRTGQVLDQLTACLGEHFDTDHCTFQVEPVGHGAHEGSQHA